MSFEPSCLGSDRDSWHILGERLGAYIRRRLPAQDVEDVLQEVYVRSLSDDSRFGPWVYSVARNAVVDRLRKKQPATAEGVDLEAIASSDDPNGEQMLINCVTPFVARLPEAYRHAVTLVELQGLTQADAAEIAGVSLSGMKSRASEVADCLEKCSRNVVCSGLTREAE